jgi:hypothetical protein
VEKTTRPAAGACGEEEGLADAVQVSGAALTTQTRYYLEPNPRPLDSLLRHSSPAQAHTSFQEKNITGMRVWRIPSIWRKYFVLILWVTIQVKTSNMRFALSMHAKMMRLSDQNMITNCSVTGPHHRNPNTSGCLEQEERPGLGRHSNEKYTSVKTGILGARQAI